MTRRCLDRFGEGSLLDCCLEKCPCDGAGAQGLLTRRPVRPHPPNVCRGHSERCCLCLALTASASGDRVWPLSSWTTLPSGFWGDGLPRELSFLVGPRTIIYFQSVHRFLVVRVMSSKLWTHGDRNQQSYFIQFLSYCNPISSPSKLLSAKSQLSSFLNVMDIFLSLP